MKIVIIEDEELTAIDLAETIIKTDPSIEITAILHSVEKAVSFFKEIKNTDLIFSDIHLGDGSSFDIFKRITIETPVIFCTAYDEYALKAFKTNGIDYVLKPYTARSITGAIEKYKTLKKDLSRHHETYGALSELIRKEANVKDPSVLVYFKDKIIPVRTVEIALFYVSNDMTHLVTLNQKKYIINKTLEELEDITGINFYRVNRKILINRRAIKDASQFFGRRLILSLTIPFEPDQPLTVSKLKVAHFLHWLKGE